jgi:transcription termination/antitermination protein NusG
MSQEQQAMMNEAPANANLRWYVVHAYSGMEKAVERNIRERIERAGMQSKFGRILVPTEEVVELKNGKKSVSERRFFPGYVLVEMVMDDETWHLVKHTSKVTGFVGGAKNRPAPISEAEVMKIVNQMQEGIEKPKPKVEWVVGEPVRVKETTRSPRCASASPSSAGPRRWNWTSRRSRRFDSLTARSLVCVPGVCTRSRSHRWQRK